MKVLGIETSCDETAASVVVREADGTGRIVSDVILSQVDAHAVFGGVVPEIAARAHVEALDRVIAAAMREAGTGFADIDAVAATAGPGLIGGVIVGLTTAKAIALAAGKPLVAVNHLEGHALTARLTDGLDFPYLLLLVSGGHTQFVAVEGVGEYRRLGTTIDDALGEAFDKAAKLLGLGYPGGPEIETAAERGDGKRFALPRPLLGRPEPDFSFSGLKTALRLAAEKIAPLSARDVDDLAASFQAAVTDVVADRAAKAMALFATEHPAVAKRTLVIAGGVAANRAIRARLVTVASKDGFTPGRAADPALHRQCGDDRLGGGGAAGARPLRPARRGGPAALAAGRMARPVLGSGAKGRKA